MSQMNPNEPNESLPHSDSEKGQTQKPTLFYARNQRERGRERRGLTFVLFFVCFLCAIILNMSGKNAVSLLQEYVQTSKRLLALRKSSYHSYCMVFVVQQKDSIDIDIC